MQPSETPPSTQIITTHNTLPVGSLLLPPSYALEFNEDFVDRFCRNPFALPTQTLRELIWNNVDGQKPRQEAQRLADCEYEAACKRYKGERSKRKTINRAIARENADALSRFDRERKVRARRISLTRLERFRQRLSNHIDRTIAAQNDEIARLVSKCFKQARLKAICSCRWFLPIVATLLMVWLAWIESFGVFVAGFFALKFWWSFHLKFITDLTKLKAEVDMTPFVVHTRVQTFPGLAPSKRVRDMLDTEDSLGRLEWKHYFFLYPICCFFMICIISHFIFCFRWSALEQEIEGTIKRRKERLTREQTANLGFCKAASFINERYPAPVAPAAKPKLPRPELPVRVIVAMPKMPAEYYDTDAKAKSDKLLRGSEIHEMACVRLLARQALFAESQARPYFPFGDVPMPFYKGQVQHMALIGTSGAGKTVLMRNLMAHLLPLRRADAERIANQHISLAGRKPSSNSEWSRSFTHQAIVYNAKNGQIPFLQALGFDPEKDLIIMDPSDPRCYAQDLAADVDDRESIKILVEQIIPMATEAKPDKNADFWLGQARDLMEDTIISYRNRAFARGEKPSWTLRDLVNAFDTPDTLRQVLQYSDKPESAFAQYLDVSPGQKDSTYITVSQYARRFNVVAARWEAVAKKGKLISLKKWALQGRHQILVLPNTKSNIKVNEPLNQLFFKALTNIFLNPKFTFVTDEAGKQRALKRVFFIDEFGHAGRLADLERLMGEGRESGIQVVLGLHQLSQARETYGKDGAETILGLCSYLAMLKTGDTTTAEWMSKRLGEHLYAYPKQSFTDQTTEGTVSGKTRGVTAGDTIGVNVSGSTAHSDSTSSTSSRGTNGSYSPHGWNSGYSNQESRTAQHSDTNSKQVGLSIQHSNSTTASQNESWNKSHSESKTLSDDYRQEAAVLPVDFMNLPDPATTSLIGGYFIVPSFPAWKAEMQIVSLLANIPAVNEIPASIGWGEDDERCSKLTSWDVNDYRRLGLEPPKNGRPPQGDLPANFDF